MKNAINIFLFTILVTAFYNYVGQVVPQKETYPPEDISISENLSTDEMVEIGREIVGGKGTCLTCHTIGASTAGRFPDLANIGINAASRKQGMSAVEYIAESMYEPNAYIAEGFMPGMPFISKPPISLNDQEILTIIAYMESLGGAPSVTMDTKLKWQSEEGAAAQPTVADPSMSPLEQKGRELFMNSACVTCHNLDSPDKLLGPSLMEVGSRLTPEDIKESIMDPDAKIAEGFEGLKGQMKLTLTAMGIYEKLTAEDLQTLVDFLASKKGN